MEHQKKNAVNLAIPGFLLAILNWTLDFMYYFLFSPYHTGELLHDISFKLWMSINYFNISSQKIHMYVRFHKCLMKIITHIPLKTGLRGWWYKGDLASLKSVPKL